MTADFATTAAASTRTNAALILPSFKHKTQHQNHLLEMDAKKAPAPTWETVRYMISCIQYGGRITDDFDQLLMDTFAEKYFHQGVLLVRKGGSASRAWVRHYWLA